LGGTDPSNVSGDPLFVISYLNTIRTAKVVDEGGNNVDVLYGPLSQSAGDYHLSTTASSAYNLGRSSLWVPGTGYPGLPELSDDFDGQSRPRYFYPDAGADELHPTYLPFANLRVSLAAFPDPVAVGQPLTLTVTVANDGPGDAEAVVAVTELPTAASFLHGAVSQGSLRTGAAAASRPDAFNPAAYLVAADVGNLASGQTAVVVLSVVPGAPGALPTSSTVDGAVTDPQPEDNAAAVSPEAMPDGDGDAAYDAIDCRPADASVWSLPGEAGLLQAEGNLFAWTPSASPGATSVTYDFLRSSSAADFSEAACLASAQSQPQAEVTEVPPPGTVFFYRVRVRNACGVTPGSGPLCP
jgi:uncharacterized repeat protein (TIGR01451 family)